MSIKKIPAVAPLKEKSYSIVTWHLDVPIDMDMEDILVPGAWAHLSGKIRLGQEIIARRSDMAWRLHLQVAEVGIGFVKVHVLSKWSNPDNKPVVTDEDTGDLPDLPDGYKVGWVPGNRTYAVRTVDPADTVSQGHKSRREAHAAAIQHAQKSLGKAA